MPVGREGNLGGRARQPAGSLCFTVLLTQSCLTICDPMDCKSVHGISTQEHWSELPFPHFLL